MLFKQVIFVGYLEMSCFGLNFLLWSEPPFSRTFSSDPSAISETALINSFGMSKPATSNFNYVELFSRSFQCSLGLFSICYHQLFHFTHSNVQRKEYIRKLWSNAYLFLFQHNNMSVNQKLNVKSLGEKYQALKDFDEPAVEPNSVEVRNELETSQKLSLYQEKGNDM